MLDLTFVLLLILLAPLAGCLIAGLLGKQVGKSGAHIITILLVAVAFIGSLWVAYQVVAHGVSYNQNIYTWGQVDNLILPVGLLIDRLTAYMMVIVTFVSLLVHIYSIGYMREDAGYQRFFSYISGFTFSMLALVMANNFLLLFFGWEAVGLFSYLLIGFWFDKESANYASLKAFIANRVGDVGFLLGIAVLLMYFGNLQYDAIFQAMPDFAAQNMTIAVLGMHWHVVTLAALLLFVGAIGKSAQIPLHIWLEGSMEGPTPISALIHAATMVTAGVFMLARLSPIFEHSAVALSVVLIIGAVTCFFMGLLAIVQMDIKRVIAYSTLSQLGYMMAAAGVSAYSLALFHLMTHAAFKALLFLAAGSVIVGLHHEQDMRYMGGLRRYMPVTYVCMLIGALALSAIPPFAGFYSKDLIIEAVQASSIPGHAFAAFLVTGGALVTAIYTFRMFFMVFHGKERMTDKQRQHLHESPVSILLPLIILAVPATLAGILFFQPALGGFFASAITVLPGHDVVGQLAAWHHGPWQFLEQAMYSETVWLALLGVAITWWCYVVAPQTPKWLARKFAPIYQLLVHKYGIDDAYDSVFGGGAKVLGNGLWRIGDMLIIDKIFVQGSGLVVRLSGILLRRLQTGYLYHYGLVLTVGLLAMLVWAIW